MRRLLIAASLALPLALPFAVNANASAEWCFDDPIVVVNGNLMDVRVTMPLANLLTMRSTAVTITVPKNVNAGVVLDDISAFPMKTTIAHNSTTWSGKGAIPITVGVAVSASKSYGLSVVATPVANLSNLLAAPHSASGYANIPFSMSMTLGR